MAYRNAVLFKKAKIGIQREIERERGEMDREIDIYRQTDRFDRSIDRWLDR